MFKRALNLKKVLAPSDSLTIVVIIVGLLIAIFLNELAIRLIGVCVAVLGAVALSMMISQRLKDFVDSRHKPAAPPPNYKITVKKEADAKRQVFEDFEKLTVEFDPAVKEDVRFSEKKQTQDEISIIAKNSKPAPPPKEYVTESGEGFRIVAKDKPKDESVTKVSESQPEQPVRNEMIPHIEPKELSYEDDFSEIRIIGKIKSEPLSEPVTTKQEQKEPSQFHTEKLSEDNIKEAISENIHDEAGTIHEGVNIQESGRTADVKEIKGKEAGSVSTYEDIPHELVPEAPVFSNEDLKAKVTSAPAMKAFEKIGKKHFDIPMSSIVETEPVAGDEPRKEFEYFLNRVLKIIRSITNTRTAAFLLVNLEKKELILQAFDSDVPESITPKFKLPIRNDIISQIVLNVKPEILTEINPSAETDLIPYYTRPVGILSFVGVPVFYNKTVIGILCADSGIIDAYDAFTVGFLGHFTKLIGTLVNTYTEKYELQQASRTLNAISSFRKFASVQNSSLDGIYNSIIESAGKIFDYSVLGICGYNQENESWKISAILSKNEHELELIGKEINLSQTLVGEAILSSKTVYVTPVMDEQIMFHRKELKYSGGFFAAVPFKSLTNTYGALFVIGKSQSNITSYDIKILETLAENAGSFIEHYLFLHMLQHSSMVDSGGILNQGAFYSRLEEEMIKSLDADSSLVLCMFKIDLSSAYNPDKYPERTEKIQSHVIGIAKKYLKVYHPFGKADGETFAIILTGSKGFEAKQWAERLRGDIAKTHVEIMNKRYYVTVSAGLCEASKNDSMETLTENVRMVLKMSEEKSNKVTVFE